MTINHDKLRHAISRLRVSAEGPSLAGRPGSDEILRVCDAAESTLPQKKWGVGVGGGCWVHFDTFDEAIAALRAEAASGARTVSIAYRCAE